MRCGHAGILRKNVMGRRIDEGTGTKIEHAKGVMEQNASHCARGEKGGGTKGVRNESREGPGPQVT